MSARKWLVTTLAYASVALPCMARAQEAAPPAAAAPEFVQQGPAPKTPPAPAESTTTPDSIAAAPTEVAPAEDASVELTAAELASMGLGTEGGAPPLDTALKFFGFADFGFNAMIGAKHSAFRGLLNRHPTFMVGNFNLYLAKNITERIRTMAEVRFTYAPNGSPDGATGSLTSTSFTDYSNSTLDTRWGGIIIQRVYVEVDLHKLATLRVGQFLTPYGVWNIDHGSPTIVTVQRPALLNQQLFPERQTGFELFGRGRVGDNHVLGYHLTLSNGFGPISEYKDLDGNKAVGGRLYWQFDKLGQLQVGSSAFYGRETVSTEVPGLKVTPSGEQRLSYTERVSSQSDVLSLAADLRWLLGNLLLQSEVVVQQRKYTDRGRLGVVNPLVGHWVSPEDNVAWGVYGLAGYRFEWFGVMPYLMGQRFQFRDPRTLSELVSRNIQAGFNVRPVDAFVVKLEYSHGAWAKKNFFASDHVQMFTAQVAWAF